MTIIDPKTTLGEWTPVYGGLGGIICRGVIIATSESSDATENAANTRMLASSKKMAEALKLMLQADENRQAADKGWDENDLESSRNRVSSAIIDGVLAEEKAKEALKEAGFVTLD